MKKEPGIKWLFMDLNSYFASVEQQEQPQFRGKPLAVVPMETDHTCAIAASYEAKAYGIKTGTIIRDAKRMCPKLQCTLARHDVYVAYHNRIIEEVVKHTPINKVWSIDELSSRLPPAKRTIEAATKIAANIKNGIWNNVGEAINCSVGVAPNSLLAKIACEMKKPNGLTILRQEDLPGPLLKLPLTALPGVGSNMKKRLNRAGIYSMQQLWDIGPKHARKIWGSVQGERLWYQIHGYDLEPPETSTSMLGHSRVLDPNLRRPDKARLIARKLATKAAHRLRNKDYFVRKISLSVRTQCGTRWGKELLLQATQDSFIILQYLDMLWHDMMQYMQHNIRFLEQPLKFKKLSVTYHGLVTKDMITDDLLLQNAQHHVQPKKHSLDLVKALDGLQQKYHKDVVSLGLPPKTAAGYVGTKIAFSRVPDQEEFWS